MIQAVHRARRIRGSLDMPGDKSISHRYALLAAIADGTTELHNFSQSRDCRSTVECLQGLGVRAEMLEDRVCVHGNGLRGFASPGTGLDAGNSGTTMRLLAGLLAGQSFESTLTGDESLRRRPMGRIADPLRRMGAVVECADGELPPLRIRGGRIQGIRYPLPVASAQVKSCVLLAGLYGDRPTAVLETQPTRDHTEIALAHFGAGVRYDNGWIEVDPEPQLQGRVLHVPGDISGAAFFLVAASLVPGSEVVLRNVGLNPRRRELLSFLQDAGVDLIVERLSEEGGEPRGDVRVQYNPSVLESGPRPISGSLVASLIDEIPVLAVLGSQSAGGLVVSDAAELRVKESDRISAVAVNLRAMGAEVEEFPDGLRVAGRQRLVGADVDTKADHRIAMAFSVAGLVADGQTRIHQAECADVSFPGFYEALRRIGDF